jgi:predicted Zn-dependent peptidase
VDTIRRELDRVAAEGLPDDELAMARQQLKGQVTLSMESVTNTMYRAAAEVLYHEPYRPLDAILAEVEAISADDVRAVCRDFFGADRQVVLSLGPKKVA